MSPRAIPAGPESLHWRLWIDELETRRLWRDLCVAVSHREDARVAARRPVAAGTPDLHATPDVPT